jgi:hypothetical protein
MKHPFMTIDRLKGRFCFNEYIFLDIKKLMLNFHDHSPEFIWPRIVEFILDTQAGLLKTIKDYKAIVTLDDINIAQKVLNDIWNANYKSLEQWDEDAKKEI